ncbi:MAG: hypothetical protein FVQ79_05195 [Planctomycetes bacterium]|nr:hypothetical protein [Planctomycetota bacterium]
MSELTDSIVEILSRLPGYMRIIASGFLESSRKTKIIISVCAGIVAILLLGQLLSGPASSPTKKSIGLRSLTQKDSNDDEWSLALVRGQVVSQLSKNGAKPGTPVTVIPDVQVTDKGLSIGLIVEGQVGEKYVGAAVKNGKWPPAPTFKVVDEAEKIIGQGQFEYG